MTSANTNAQIAASDFGFSRMVYSYARQLRMERRKFPGKHPDVGGIRQVVLDVLKSVKRACKIRRFLRGVVYERNSRVAEEERRGGGGGGNGRTALGGQQRERRRRASARLRSGPDGDSDDSSSDDDDEGRKGRGKGRKRGGKKGAHREEEEGKRTSSIGREGRLFWNDHDRVAAGVGGSNRKEKKKGDGSDDNDDGNSGLCLRGRKSLQHRRPSAYGMGAAAGPSGNVGGMVPGAFGNAGRTADGAFLNRGGMADAGAFGSARGMAGGAFGYAGRSAGSAFGDAEESAGGAFGDAEGSAGGALGNAGGMAYGAFGNAGGSAGGAFGNAGGSAGGADGNAGGSAGGALGNAGGIAAGAFDSRGGGDGSVSINGAVEGSGNVGRATGGDNCGGVGDGSGGVGKLKRRKKGFRSARDLSRTDGQRAERRRMNRSNSDQQCFVMMMEKACQNVTPTSPIESLLELDAILKFVQPRIHEFRGLSVAFWRSLKHLLRCCEDRMRWGRDKDTVEDIRAYWSGVVEQFEGRVRHHGIRGRRDVDSYRGRELDGSADGGGSRMVVYPGSPRDVKYLLFDFVQASERSSAVMVYSYHVKGLQGRPRNRQFRPPWLRPPLGLQRIPSRELLGCDPSELAQYGDFSTREWSLIGEILDLNTDAADTIARLSLLGGEDSRGPDEHTGFCHD